MSSGRGRHDESPAPSRPMLPRTLPSPEPVERPPQVMRRGDPRGPAYEAYVVEARAVRQQRRDAAEQYERDLANFEVEYNEWQQRRVVRASGNDIDRLSEGVRSVQMTDDNGNGNGRHTPQRVRRDFTPLLNTPQRQRIIRQGYPDNQPEPSPPASPFESSALAWLQRRDAQSSEERAAAQGHLESSRERLRTQEMAQRSQEMYTPTRAPAGGPSYPSFSPPSPSTLLNVAQQNPQIPRSISDPLMPSRTGGFGVYGLGNDPNAPGAMNPNLPGNLLARGTSQQSFTIDRRTGMITVPPAGAQPPSQTPGFIPAGQQLPPGGYVVPSGGDSPLFMPERSASPAPFPSSPSPGQQAGPQSPTMQTPRYGQPFTVPPSTPHAEGMSPPSPTFRSGGYSPTGFVQPPHRSRTGFVEESRSPSPVGSPTPLQRPPSRVRAPSNLNPARSSAPQRQARAPDASDVASGRLPAGYMFGNLAPSGSRMVTRIDGSLPRLTPGTYPIHPIGQATRPNAVVPGSLGDILFGSAHHRPADIFRGTATDMFANVGEDVPNQMYSRWQVGRREGWRHETRALENPHRGLEVPEPIGDIIYPGEGMIGSLGAVERQIASGAPIIGWNRYDNQLGTPSFRGSICCEGCLKFIAHLSDDECRGFNFNLNNTTGGAVAAARSTDATKADLTQNCCQLRTSYQGKTTCARCRDKQIGCKLLDRGHKNAYNRALNLMELYRQDSINWENRQRLLNRFDPVERFERVSFYRAIAQTILDRLHDRRRDVAEAIHDNHNNDVDAFVRSQDRLRARETANWDNGVAFAPSHDLFPLNMRVGTVRLGNFGFDFEARIVRRLFELGMYRVLRLYYFGDSF